VQFIILLYTIYYNYHTIYTKNILNIILYTTIVFSYESLGFLNYILNS